MSIMQMKINLIFYCIHVHQFWTLQWTKSQTLKVKKIMINYYWGSYNIKKSE